MKNNTLLFLLLALAGLASNPAQAAKSIGYWYNSSGNIVRSGLGECVRSNEWSPSNALPECEGKSTKKTAKAKTEKKVTNTVMTKGVAKTEMKKEVTKSSIAKKSAKSIGYWYNSSGTIVRSGLGDCVRSNNWSPNNALAECEGKMAKTIAKAETAKKVASVVAIKEMAKVAMTKKANKSIVAKKSAKSAGYWYNSSGTIVRSGLGDCVRSNDWSPSNALAECGDKIEKKIAKVKKPIKVAKVETPIVVAKIDIDSDNDGVIDTKDQCKGSKAGTKVGADGCDLNKDTDDDGIADASDNCGGTAAGAIVDTHGCVLKVDISLDNVQFNFDIATLSSSSRKILDDIAQTLKENKHLRFEVAGYTDDSGDHMYNVNLSGSRAQTVRQYLIDKGVAADRLEAHGYGPAKPIASNDTRVGRIKNRRVELSRQ